MDTVILKNNTSASVVVEGFSGAVNGEDTSVVKVLASGRFANKDAGQGKEVAVRFSLAGSGAGNYVLALPSQTLMASILPKPVSLEWAEAVYGFDGEVHTVSATVSGAVAPDVVLVEEYGGVRSESKVGVYTATAVALNSTNYVVTLGETFNWQIAEGGLNGLAIKWVYPDSVYTYTGQEVEPEFNLVMGDEVIDPSEYKVIFKNNVLAGEAQIVVNDAEGGTYTFAPVTGSFVIAKAWAYVGWNQIPYFEYDGTPKMVDATVYKWDGAAWVENEEVHITRYVDNVKTDTGTYVARAVEINSENYNIASPDTLLWQIAPRQVNTRDVIVYLEEGNFVYNGAEHRPAVLSVMVGDDVLAPSQYKVTYENNVNAGQASVIIADADPKDYYQFNNVVQKFTIQQIEVCLEWETDEFVFDGDPKEVSATVPASSLVEGDVCEVSSYADNVYYASVKTNVGKYMAKANGLSNPNYRLGSTSACYILNWSIKPRTVLSDEIAINVLPYDTVYSATEKTPSVVVMVGDAEVMPNEYHVAYENNLHAGTATVRITDINPNGNYQLPEAVAQFPIKQLEAVLVWSGNDNSYFQGVERKVLATVGNALASEDRKSVV